MQQFKSKNSEFWKWLLWAAISSFIVVVGWSIYHMTPGLVPIAIAMCIAGLGVSFVYSVYTTVNAPSLRYRAWVSEALIVAGLCINVVIHAGLSRRFDVATQAREARHVEEERQQQAAEAGVKRAKELADVAERNAAAQAGLLESQRKLTESQNRQLYMLPQSQRRITIPQQSGIQVGETSSVTAPTPILTAGTEKQAQVSMLTPEQVQEMAWWWVLGGILAEVGMIGGTFIYFVRGYIGDANKNSVADWKEELEPEALRESYPDDYRRLYRQSPAMSPAGQIPVPKR